MLEFKRVLKSSEEIKEFEHFYKKYHHMIYKASYSVLRDHHLAQDATQIAFEKIANKFKWMKSDNLIDNRGYIYQLSRNTAKNLLRKEKDTPCFKSFFEENYAKDEEQIEKKLIEIENHGETFKLLDAINASYGEIIYLKFYREFDNAEISELLGITPNAVRVRLYRAVNALKKVIEKEAKVSE